MRQGPIPDADELVRYGEAHPDAPAIILAEFRNQAAHRRMLEQRAQGLERRAMDAAILSERIGVASALVIALVGFGCATYLVATGHAVAGTVNLRTGCWRAGVRVHPGQAEISPTTG